MTRSRKNILILKQISKNCLKMQQIASQRIFISKHFRGGHAPPPQEACDLLPLRTSPPNDKS